MSRRIIPEPIHYGEDDDDNPPMPPSESQKPSNESSEQGTIKIIRVDYMNEQKINESHP